MDYVAGRYSRVGDPFLSLVTLNAHRYSRSDDPLLDWYLGLFVCLLLL